MSGSIRPRAVALLLVCLLPGGLLQADVDDRQAVVDVLRQYHAAFSAGAPERVAALLGPSFFIAGERSDRPTERIAAHLYHTGPKLAAWPGNYLEQAGPHVNEFETISVSIRHDSAVLLTRDTGSNRFRSWKDEEVAWFLGRSGGEWRIVGMIIRDIQLPTETP